MFVVNRNNAEAIARELGIQVDAVSPIFTPLEKNMDIRIQLEHALSCLPVPRAFYVAVRLFRKIKKEKLLKDYEELKEIYRLAVIYSFINEPYSKIAGCPSYNVLLLAYKKISKMTFDYNVFGYEKLTLLNKSDIKELVSFYGEPRQHSSLNEVENELYKYYELKAKTAIIL